MFDKGGKRFRSDDWKEHYYKHINSRLTPTSINQLPDQESAHLKICILPTQNSLQARIMMASLLLHSPESCPKLGVLKASECGGVFFGKSVDAVVGTRESCVLGFVCRFVDL